MPKIGPWVRRILNKSGEKLSKEEQEMIELGRNPAKNKCRCCGERFITENGLREHYARRHPDLSTGWLLREDEIE